MSCDDAEAYGVQPFGPRKPDIAVCEVDRPADLDRPLFTDHNNMTASVTRCEVLEAVEKAIGPLQSSSA